MRIKQKTGYPPIDIKFADRIAYYNAFDEYYVKHNLSAMETFLRVMSTKDWIPI